MCAYKILGLSSGRTFGNAEVVLRELLMECENIEEAGVRIARLCSLKINGCDILNGLMKLLINAWDAKIKELLCCTI